MQVLHDWQNFYMLTGAAAATLIGLLFVAISMAANLNISFENSMEKFRTFVNPVLLYYCQSLFIGCLAVMPLQSLVVLVCIIGGLGTFNAILVLKLCWRLLMVHRNDHIDLEHWLWNAILPGIVSLLLLGASIAFLFGLNVALLVLASANLLCLAIGLRNTWSLTIWFIRYKDLNKEGIGENQRDDADIIPSII